jgi:integrase
VAKLVREGGNGSRQVRRADGHAEQYARSPRWRVRFVVSYPDGSRTIRSKLTPRKAEAGLLRTEASRFERLSRTGTATQQDLGHFLRLGLISRDDYLRLGGTQLDMSWDEVLSTYISSSYGRCRYFTHRNNVARAERIVAFLRERAAVARIADEDIRAYLTSRSTEVSKKTMKVELDVARQLLDYPVGRGVLRQPPWNLLMSANPARRVNGFESPVARTRFPRALSFEEDLQLLALVREVEATAPALAAAILLLRFYGLRRAELQYLTHADLVGPAVLVQAKPVLPDVLGPGRASASPVGRHRSVIERQETRDQFKDGMWRVKDHEARTIWVPTAGGDPDPRPMERIRPLLLPKAAGRFILGGHHTLHRDAISQAVERVLHRIDPDLSTHCLRHSFATWLIGRGVNVVRVKELMGHSDLKTTLVYTHLPRPGDPKDILDRL